MSRIGLSDIAKIESGNIVLQAKGISPELIPSIDIETHSLSLLLLAYTNRKHLYVFDEKSLKIVKKAIGVLKEEYVQIKKTQMKFLRYLFSLLVLVFFTLLEFALISRENVEKLSNIGNFIKLWQLLYRGDLNIISELKPSTFDFLVLFLGIYLTIFSFRVLDILIKEGAVNGKILLKNLPIIARIYKWLEGRK